MRDNIFTELYNKLLGFFRQAEEEETAKDVACNRLRVVLMQDRTNLTPQLLEKMRGELVELLSKYLEMDKEALELNLEQEGEQMALMLSIPVIRAKTECELSAEGSQEVETVATLNASNKADEEEIEEALAQNNAENVADGSDECSDTEELQEQIEEVDEDKNSEVEEQNVKKEKPVKKFPNKEICGDCRECELSDDIECEKKKQVKK